ncbi:MAG: hypothetical protein B0A82_17190 [Alkalinema sp. CACIAM 70d]|nr:MAG: hypothetical protein B0A82_17190 [Alkalinema sp. CACIAM 70d]
MPAVQLKHGSKLRFNGLPYQVIGRTAETDKILLLNDDTLEELRLSQNEIAAEIAKCRLELIPDVSGSSGPELLLEHLQKDPINLSEKASSEYKRRSEYFKAITEIRPRFYSAPYITPVISAVAEKLGETPPSLSTIYRWRREYLAANCDFRALTPGFSRRGNRKRRLDPYVIRVIEDAINTNYLVPERPPVAQLAAAVISTIVKKNRELPDSSTIPIPSDRTIYRAVSAIAPDYKVKKRYGNSAEYIRFHVVQARPKACRVLERWEMDHCKLDLFVIDDDFKSPYGRPWLTTIIDVYSGMIVGFHLSFDSPTKQSALSALKHAVLSKAEHLKRYPDIVNSWDAYGVPTTLVVDNGQEFHAPDFVAACHYLGTTIQYTKARSPWLKGNIERHFGALNQSLLAGMKGYTFADTKSKGDYDPKKNAAIGLRKLEGLLYHWIVDVPHRQPVRTGAGDARHGWPAQFREGVGADEVKQNS